MWFVNFKNLEDLLLHPKYLIQEIQSRLFYRTSLHSSTESPNTIARASCLKLLGNALHSLRVGHTPPHRSTFFSGNLVFTFTGQVSYHLQSSENEEFLPLGFFYVTFS